MIGPAGDEYRGVMVDAPLELPEGLEDLRAVFGVKRT